MEKWMVSVVTITYNAEKTIKRTIESVLNQDYKNMEYIIIDGGSTDNTLNIIKSYHNENITVISEPDEGISDAFNKGIHVAKGDFIGLLNADDSYLPHALSNIMSCCNENTEVLYGNSIIQDDKNKLILKKKAQDCSRLKYELPFIHQSSFVKKSAYEKYGTYLTNYKICMDYELFARMYQNKAVFQYVDTYVSLFAYGGTSCAHPFKTINENTFIAEQYGLKKQEALKYKINLYIRNGIKLCLQKLQIWSFFYKIVKREYIYKD